MISSVYSFFGEGIPVYNSSSVLMYSCNACVKSGRKKQTFRAQIDVSSNLINHLVSVHSEDDFYKDFLKQDKENLCTPSSNVSIILNQITK